MDKPPTIRWASVCSGIGAPEVAWQDFGWEHVFCSEIEPFPSAVLRYHFPDVPNLGDFTKVENEHGPIDLLVGGTPCQDFSVAGLRAGLAGDRGQLTIEFLKLAGRLRPKWLVWENVPGILSDDGGKSFGVLLGELGKLGYGFAYRVSDAQYFGVPQRRRRVFVVGCLGDWRRAAAVLFERESLSGHPPPSREKRKGIAGGIEIGPSGGSFTDLNPTLDAPAKDGPIRNQLAGAVMTASGRGFERAGDTRGNDAVVAVSHDPACTLTAREYKGALPEADLSTVVYGVAHSLRADGFDASEDGTGRSAPLVPVAYRTAGDGAVYEEGAATAPLTTATDPCTNIVAFRASGQEGFTPSEIAPPINATDGGGAGVPTICFSAAQTSSNGWGVNEDSAYTLDGAQGQAVATQMAVRRLLPVECARLQGFPDTYLDIMFRGKPASDGAKYKALGNSMAVPVMRWIGLRIMAVEETV